MWSGALGSPGYWWAGMRLGRGCYQSVFASAGTATVVGKGVIRLESTGVFEGR